MGGVVGRGGAPTTTTTTTTNTTATAPATATPATTTTSTTAATPLRSGAVQPPALNRSLCIAYSKLLVKG